ncbi:glycosyltransferase [Leptolyngbya sp. FACHB-541]|uniref:glycosyltransferase n=1 Tax=Leptolyngbya sp. FACHB-541 TaxID=2692810 RepID=UPI0016888105|nr:glycosyltransferase [Leptolyngbya sp. FACHB-541]MBD2001057.1 glycosyltransferase [Leptolyngbya sp. FACHB-541]
MKILHVIPGLSPALGGPPQVALNLVKSLRDLGVDAEIATTNFDHPHPLDVPLNQRVDYTFGSDSSDSVPVWFLPFNPPALKEFIFSKALTDWCWKHIPNYNVLDNHYLFSYAPTCAAAIARWHRTPYTVRVMGQLTPWALAQSRLKKQLYSTLIERHNLNAAAAIHCTTHQEAAEVRHFGIKAPTVTLPLGVHAPAPNPEARSQLRAQYQISTDTPVILFLSRLHYKKRPELLLQTLHQLKQQNYQFHLLIAGTGEPDYVQQLKQSTASLGLTDNVSFTGLVLGAEKDRLLQGSDLFVLPSYSENFGIAVAEALICGLPVVITPGIQIASDVATAEAGLVVEGAEKPLGEAIAQLITSPKLRQELGERGRDFAKSQYSWCTIAQNLIPAYETIAKQKRRPCLDI